MSRILMLTILSLLVVGVQAQSNLPGRNRSIDAELRRNSSKPAVTHVDTPHYLSVDTLLTPSIPFTPVAITMMGYSKRINDSHESFILRNNTTNYHISRVLIRMVYVATDGDVVFHNREELVECDLAPGATRMVNIKSFDKGKTYYHHTVPPARASGIPYEVKYDVVRYDVVVE